MTEKRVVSRKNHVQAISNPFRLDSLVPEWLEETNQGDQIMKV